MSPYPPKLVRKIEDNSMYGRTQVAAPVRKQSDPITSVVAPMTCTILIVAALLAWWLPRQEQAHCASIASQSHFETKYAGGTYWTRDCYIRLDDEWVPVDNWRVSVTP